MKPIEFMNGKKTATGGALAGLTGIATAICLLWDIQSDVVDKAITTVNLAAGFFGTTGIGHKLWKRFKR